MADGAELLVRVKLSGRTIELEATPDLTVEALKALLEEPSGLLSEHQRLIYKGRVLRDEATLSALGYCAGTHLHLVRGGNHHLYFDMPDVFHRLAAQALA